MIDTSDLRSFQRDYVENRALDAACYLMWEARLGKTRAEVRAAERRIEVGSRRILIVGPQKPLQLTWKHELALRGLQHLPLDTGSVEDRAAALRAHMTSAASDHPTFVTVNFDVLEKPIEPLERVTASDGNVYPGFRGKPYADLREARAAQDRLSATLADVLAEWNPHDIIVDEAQLISTAGAKRSWALRRLARGAICRRLLSGTPDPNGSIGFYSQFTFLDPKAFEAEGVDASGKPVHLSGTRKADFMAQYCYVDPHNHAILAYQNVDRMLSIVFRYAHRVRARDVYGEVPEENVTRLIAWPKPARKLYDTLRRDHVLTGDIEIDGTHKLTRLLRHQQMCSGFLVDQATNELRWIHKEKLDALTSELEEIIEADKMVVVSYSYTIAGEAIRDAIAARFGAEKVALVNGKTSEKQANAILDTFNIDCHTETPIRVLVLQEQVGGMGISLARAQYMIFFSWTMDYNIHEQMRKRVWNETRTTFWIYLEMERSADGFARAIVSDKHNASIMQKEFDFEAALIGQVA